MEIKVDSFEKTPDHIEWYLSVKLKESQETIVTRYSELLLIHKKFAKANSGRLFPEFPPKKLFGNRKEKFLQRRMTYQFINF